MRMLHSVVWSALLMSGSAQMRVLQMPVQDSWHHGALKCCSWLTNSQQMWLRYLDAVVCSQKQTAQPGAPCETFLPCSALGAFRTSFFPATMLHECLMCWRQATSKLAPCHQFTR